MTTSNSPTMNREDRIIIKMLFGFLTTPLALLMGAAAVATL